MWRERRDSEKEEKGLRDNSVVFCIRLTLNVAEMAAGASLYHFLMLTGLLSSYFAL